MNRVIFDGAILSFAINNQRSKTHLNYFTEIILKREYHWREERTKQRVNTFCPSHIRDASALIRNDELEQSVFYFTINLNNVSYRTFFENKFLFHINNFHSSMT